MNRSFAAALAAFLLGIAALVPAAATAQGRPLQQVLDLNRQAMEAYNNLEIEQAQQLLQQALDAATRGHVTGAPLARTYVNLGIVAIAGLGDNGAGLNYFVSGLQADGSVALDPLLSTPDIQLIWTQAHARAGGGGTTTVITPPPDTSGGGPVGDLTHQPVPEQLRQTPVPVYVEVPGRPAHVYLYYRGHGMRDFERAEMDHVGRGFGYEIPCGDVFEPEVTYYIAVFDSSGSPISFAGSQGSPISVPIVATRSTSAPALPGRAPPTQCTSMEEECPPDLPGCHTTASTGTRGLGDSCRVDNDCSSGFCEDDLCAIGERAGGGGGGGGGGGSEDNGAPRFFTRISVGTGLSYVQNGMPTDRNVCNQDADDSSPDSCTQVDNPQPVPAGDFTHITTANHVGDNMNGGSPTYGYDDTGIQSFNGSLGPDAAQTCPFTDRHCFYVESPGFVANLSLRLDIGYYIVPRWFAVAAMFRFQPISGMGTLPFMQIGLRVETELTEPTPVGFHVHLHLGFVAYGQIQVFLPRRSDVSQYAPWGASGYQGVDFGSTIGYRFMPNFGIHIQPTFIFNFPSFLFTLDLMAGFEVGF
jgi:hypothetical protein